MKILEEIHNHIANKISKPTGTRWWAFMFTNDSVGYYLEDDTFRWHVRLAYFETHIIIANGYRSGGQVYPALYYSDPNFISNTVEIVQEAVNKPEQPERIYTNPTLKLNVVKTF